MNITIPKYDTAKVTASVAPPLYYIVPAQWQKVIEVIKAHGIKFERIEKPLTIEVESYRLTEPKFAPMSFESHNTVSFKTIPVKETRTFPANSIVIPLDQETANVAIHLLEPDSPDSFAYWGFFSAIFEQKEYGEAYVLEKLAREMLAKDAEFEKGIRGKIKRRKLRQKRTSASDIFLRTLAVFRQTHRALSGRANR